MRFARLELLNPYLPASPSSFEKFHLPKTLLRVLQRSVGTAQVLSPARKDAVSVLVLADHDYSLLSHISPAVGPPAVTRATPDRDLHHSRTWQTM